MPEHGARTMYVHYGCRCEECCKAEHRQYLKRPETKKRKRVYSKHGDIPEPSKTERQRIQAILRRRALRQRPHANSKPIHWRELVGAYGGICAICGEPVDENDTWLSENGRKCFGRHYPTVDHIVALKNGGTDTFDNVQLLCKHCNSKKGVSVFVPPSC